ncbi:MAG: DNA polymerase/3'-5' exonuclease PolX [Actinobacteria bacterium]|nr:DNA polymerase/3'-5' exonuclease PolX [Actinomycetota bacterium]
MAKRREEEHRIDNEEVARVLDEIGDLLEILGESSFRVGAYHKAAMNIRSMPRSIRDVYESGELQKIPGVGAHLAERIGILITTGKLPYLEDLKKKVPPSLTELMSIPGLGGKKAKKLYDELNVTSIAELKRAIEKHELRDLPGMGAKTEENIIRGIRQLEQLSARTLLFQALPISEEIVNQLRARPFVKRVDAAGSLRRLKETVGDIDLLCSSAEPRKVMDYFTSLPQVAYTIARGDKKSTIVVTSGYQIDLRVVAPEEFGAALQYFTGSKSHNIHVREIAKKHGLKINEYGVFKVDTNERVAGATEDEVYGYLGLDTPPPVLREDRGEIEAAAEHRLPRLIELSDVKGDLQMHTNATDGVDKLEAMIEMARSLGYSYICITDHAERLYVAGGLTEKELREEYERIDRLNESYDGFTILKGIELNIDNDGDVDYPDSFLAEMDVVIGSIHAGFNQPKSQLTGRMVKAMENPHIDIIAHPTGRVLGKRPAYDIDLPTVFKVAAETGTVLELNSFPDRLDLRDDYLMDAKFNYGCRFAINTDAHNVNHLRYMRYGVATAQRGWLERKDVVNTHPLKQMLMMLK